jgi:4-amino-4-deoxy-L-arabinose transferase-like glycosyltransferase
MVIKKSESHFWLLTLSLAVFTLLIHLLTCTNYELHRDELLYMAMGQHPAFGYMSTPPLMGFMAYVLTHFFGTSEWAVKILPALSGTLSVIIIAMMVREMGGRGYAVFVACLAFILSPAFLHTCNLFMPVPFDQLFWLLLAYLTLKLVISKNEKYWIGMGLVLGAAFLNKYSILFFFTSIFISLLLSDHRKLIWSKYFLFAMILALIVVSPNLFWQVEHHFPVVTHMAELQRRQLVHENPATFMTGQLHLNLPCFFIWLTGLIGCLLIKAERRIRFIGLSYLLVIAILMLGRGKAYYALGAYPMLFAAGGYVMEKYFTGWLAWLGYIFVGFAIALSVLILPHSLPLLGMEKMESYCRISSRYLGDWATRWEDGSQHTIPQTYADMTGWKQLAAIVTAAYQGLDGDERKHCLIFTQNYGQAGAIQYYGRPYGLPEPVCLNDAFLFWAPDSVNNTTLIVVDDQLGSIDDLFSHYSVFGTVNDKYFRENGLHVYICRDPKPFWQRYYKERVRKLKNEF